MKTNFVVQENLLQIELKQRERIDFISRKLEYAKVQKNHQKIEKTTTAICKWLCLKI